MNTARKFDDGKDPKSLLAELRINIDYDWSGARKATIQQVPSFVRIRLLDFTHWWITWYATGYKEKSKVRPDTDPGTMLNLLTDILFNLPLFIEVDHGRVDAERLWMTF